MTSRSRCYPHPATTPEPPGRRPATCATPCEVQRRARSTGASIARTRRRPTGDYIIGDIRAEATPLQTSVNKDLEVNGSNWIVFASAGAGTGTHGWADASKIVLIPRTFSKDGDWNFDGVNLTPNASSTGGYKISDIEQIAHRYVNKIPCSGTVPYFSITSDETSLLPPNYYVRITCKTEDGGNFAQVWGLCVLLEIYRQRTHNP